MKTKHTPGPWTIEIYHGSLFKICKSDFKVADEVRHRLEADARLIAAAPEMLEALEMVLRETDDAEWISKIEAVLAKARGEK